MRAAGVGDDELVEQIDIGGPAMIRAAAKNHARVRRGHLPRPVPRDHRGARRPARRELCRRCGGAWPGPPSSAPPRYDGAIADWLDRADEDEFPERDPHELPQAARALATARTPTSGPPSTPSGRRAPTCWRASEQLHGKELSFNNLLDLDAARGLLAEFELPACVIVKHNNPCGVAISSDVRTAYERARDCDPVSAYGGVIVVNRPVDARARRAARRHLRRGAVHPRLRRGGPRRPHAQAQHAHPAERRRGGGRTRASAICDGWWAACWCRTATPRARTAGA